MRNPLFGTVLITLACAAARGQSTHTDVLLWNELPPLPDPTGFAGPFAGVSHGALIVAGGANFPGGRPWDGHPKVWHDRIFVLESADGPWRRAERTLPRPAAYGVSATWNDRVICVGGGDAERHHTDVYALEWIDGSIHVEDLPPLPHPAAFFCGALAGDTLYVAGGIDEPAATTAMHTFWALDLSAVATGAAWRQLPPWPAPERHLSVAAAHDGSFYLFGGIGLEAGAEGAPSRIKPFFSDAWCYTPAPDGHAGAWRALADLPAGLAASPTPAVNIGPSHIFVFGGDDGTLSGDLRDAHPGFSGQILAYHTITDTWTPMGMMPKDPGPDPANDPAAGVWPTVTTVTVQWDGRTVIPTGEARPGVRSPRVLVAEPTTPAPRFGLANYSVLVAYLLGLVVMGFYFSRREKTTNDYFLGGRRVPAWAAGVSIFGTQLSAITFLAIPAKSYDTNWFYFVQNLGIVAIAPIVVYLYLPFFRRLNVTTAYEYLEHRFNLFIRLLGSASFVAFQIARMGIVMFLPAMALTAVTGIDIRLCIIAMGLLCTFYTVLGGIEAVIWTDVLQVLVLFGGALLALLIIVADVDGGVAGVFALAADADKLRLADFSWDWTGPAIGVILLGAVFNNIVPYTSDQAVVQRYLTTKDEKHAARAIWIGAWLSVPASLVFFSMGTALFAFYKTHPGELNPAGPTDQVFAWFIVRELPIGVSGLVIAGVFAAAMSSLDSSMNSITAALTTDFYRRFRGDISERHYLGIARALTLVLGLLGTGAALLMAEMEVRSLLDAFLEYLGLLGGMLAGLFVLGIFSTRASAAGAIVGALASIAALVYVRFWTDLSGLLNAAIAVSTCAAVGWAASLVLPRHAKPIAGLTIRTMTSREAGS